MEKLIQNASEHGFQSRFLYNKPYKYSSLESLRRLFWLTELKQFLHTKYRTYVRVNLRLDGMFEFSIQTPMTNDNDDEYSYINDSTFSYYTEDDALEAGIEYFFKYNPK